MKSAGSGLDFCLLLWYNTSATDHRQSILKGTTMDNYSNGSAPSAKEIIYKIIEYGVCFLIGLAIVLGVKSCMKNAGMPEDFKDAKKLLKNEGFSDIKYTDDEDKIDDLFDEIDIDDDGVSEVLAALNKKSGDLFIVAYCDSTSAAEDLMNEFAWEIAGDDELYENGYTARVNYRTVYFGHEDLVSELID